MHQTSSVEVLKMMRGGKFLSDCVLKKKLCPTPHKSPPGMTSGKTKSRPGRNMHEWNEKEGLFNEVCNLIECP